MLEATGVNLAVVFVEIEGFHPPVWRRLLVSFFTKLAGLHRVVQAAMGWDNRFPHSFILCGDLLERVAAGEALDAKREQNWRLDSAGYPDHYFWYAYGLAGEWRLRIILENYIQGEERWRYPRCVGGVRSCVRLALKLRPTAIVIESTGGSKLELVTTTFAGDATYPTARRERCW